MSATTHRVTCPICGRRIRQAPQREVMIAHTDTTSKTCPFSGQPIGTHMSDPEGTLNP